MDEKSVVFSCVKTKLVEVSANVGMTSQIER